MRFFITLMLLTASMTAFAQTQALSQLVYELRNPKTNPANFRQTLETIGEYLARQLQENLITKEVTVNTLTGVKARSRLINETPTLVTILRAGLPLNAGVQKVFPNAEVGFIAMSRDEKTFAAKVEYVAFPDIKNKTVILADTMLATGGSIIDALKIIEEYKPKQIFVIAAVASKPGIERIAKYNPNIKIFAAVVDPRLNDKGYIIPGLGDAGDRAYGKKKVT